MGIRLKSQTAQPSVTYRRMGGAIRTLLHVLNQLSSSW